MASRRGEKRRKIHSRLKMKKQNGKINLNILISIIN